MPHSIFTRHGKRIASLLFVAVLAWLGSMPSYWQIDGFEQGRLIALGLIGLCFVTISLLPEHSTGKISIRRNLMFWVWGGLLLISAPFIILFALMGVNDIETVQIFIQGTHVSDALRVGSSEYLIEILIYTIALLTLATSSAWLMRRLKGFGWVLLLLSLCLANAHPLIRYIRYAVWPPAEHQLIEVARDVKAPEITGRPTAQKNLILLYLEGYEQNFFRIPALEDAVGPLARIGAAGQELKQVSQVSGSDFSIAGIVATQCGLPLLPSSLYSPSSSWEVISAVGFMPNVTCLGDILNADGYQLSFLVGSDASQYALRGFHTRHGYTRVIDENDVPENRKAGHSNLWGLTDDLMFEEASRELHRLAADEAPFVLSMLTQSTHGPNGFPSEQCRANRPENEHTMVSALACTALQVEGFLQEVEELGLSEDTITVVLSDHLSWPNGYTRTLEELGPRENFVVFVNSEAQIAANRPALALDLFPTILEALGYELRGGQANMGVSLTGDHPSLRDRLSLENIDAAFRGNRKLGNELWQIP